VDVEKAETGEGGERKQGKEPTNMGKAREAAVVCPLFSFLPSRIHH
jgi:hypothetical protein